MEPPQIPGESQQRTGIRYLPGTTELKAKINNQPLFKQDVMHKTGVCWWVRVMSCVQWSRH